MCVCPISPIFPAIAPGGSRIAGTHRGTDMQCTCGRASSMRGFTLIELMVVVAIVAIIAAVALPSYTDYLKRSKLTEAYNTLATYRASMEQYYQDNRSYGAGGSCGVAVPTGLKYFTLSCGPAAASTAALQAYVATAKGIVGSQVAGFTFTINEKNDRATTAVQSGWGTAPTNCWVIRKGGGCQ